MQPGVQPCRGRYKRYVTSFSYNNDVHKILELLQTLNHEKNMKVNYEWKNEMENKQNNYSKKKVEVSNKNWDESYYFINNTL